MLGHVGEMLSGDVLGADTGLDLTPTCHLSPNDVLVLPCRQESGYDGTDRRNTPLRPWPRYTRQRKIKPDWASRRAA